ncbi:MAG: threonine/serine dehydratase [Bryobacteraceae bacterium]
MRLSFARVQEAARSIDRVFLHSPQYVCEPLGDALGVPLTLKVETLNPVRCFKGRGASYCVSGLPEDGPIVCASAGNFGQAMAYACRARGRALIVYAGEAANPLKIARMHAMGAEVRLAGTDFDGAKLEARRFAAEAGLRFVEDGLEAATAEGAGTIGVELSSLSLEAALVPLGNGALLAGVALALRTLAPGVKIIAVQAAGAPAMTESLRSGKLVSYSSMSTIADGIGVRIPIPEALADLTGMVDQTLLVEERSIVAAMQLIHRHAGMVVEPSGAVGVAALLENPNLFPGRRVGAILCGGNLTEEQMREWLMPGGRH